MSDQQNQDEPSMEEILASIRRIISEDDPEEGQGEEEVAAEPEAAAEESADDEEDELELTEKVEIEAPAEEAATPEEDVEVEAVEEEIPEPKPIFDEGDAEEAPAPEPEIELEAEPEAEAELEAVEDEAQEPNVALELDDELLEENKSDGGESLISEPTQVAASSALSEIAKAALTQRALAIGDGRTLEDLVREALRPELKLWLDAHLASMVERIVREEIKKMVRRVENQ
ncbi:DUF2497 domain-containing protein [Pelagibius sp. Alg239-R121]|uniref:DUF2497 domain-containing protein n=1 Tax=Pelagibius sp. Alg239-R121 TaxID=2993448 RepID=UPI0024A665D5|nr:DUF2497 domain-containing protein [Pelagibius sp. Alg239-R121]